MVEAAGGFPSLTAPIVGGQRYRALIAMPTRGLAPRGYRYLRQAGQAKRRPSNTGIGVTSPGEPRP